MLVVLAPQTARPTQRDDFWRTHGYRSAHLLTALSSPGHSPDHVHSLVWRFPGPWLGALNQALSIILGGIGLPVLAGGKARFGTVAGPTGGYLLGFVTGPFVIGFNADLRKQPTLLRIVMSSVLGTLVIHLFGVAQLAFCMNGNLQHALIVGVLPFIVGDTVKTIVGVVVASRLKVILPMAHQSNKKGLET